MPFTGHWVERQPPLSSGSLVSSASGNRIDWGNWQPAYAKALRTVDDVSQHVYGCRVVNPQILLLLLLFLP